MPTKRDLAGARTGARVRGCSRLTLVRLGRNEALARGPGADGRPPRAGEQLPFRCECEGERCRETLLLTRAEYDHVRAQRGLLIVFPGHQVAGSQLEERLGVCVVVRSKVEAP